MSDAIQPATSQPDATQTGATQPDPFAPSPTGSTGGGDTAEPATATQETVQTGATQPDALRLGDWKERYAQSMLGVFGSPQLVLSHGEGVWVFDQDAQQYMDLLGGIAVNGLGHAHPNVVTAVSGQVQKLLHVSNFFTTEPAMRLGEALRQIVTLPGKPVSKASRVFLSNSGTEANEAALKIVKAWGNQHHKPRILALQHGFHGRSLGALSLTHKPAYREPFAPLLPHVQWLEPNDLTQLTQAFQTQDVAGIFLEPIQGEGGVLGLDHAYVQKARALCDQTGALLVMDEVQTGMGRCGDWMGHHVFGISPDVVTLAKSLGAGMPIAATITLNEDATSVLTPGMHGTTFGGNPVAAAAALAVVETIEQDDLLTHVRQLGSWWKKALKRLDISQILDVRGRGLLIGIELDGAYAGRAVDEARQAGFIINAVRPTTLRLAPPLIITQEQAEQFNRALPQILQRAQEGSSDERS